MAVLMLVRMRGPTKPLLAAAEDVERRMGMPDGLLARVVATSEDGIVLVNVWASEDARRASNDAPEHRAAVRASGIESLAEETIVERLETTSVAFGRR
jgi:heme-degrading monooxygenase HmoA